LESTRSTGMADRGRKTCQETAEVQEARVRSW